MIRRQRVLYLLGLVGFAVAVLLAVRFLPRVVRSLAFALDESPYQMTLTPASGGSHVSFTQPGRGLVSPIFETDLKVDTPRTVVLVSDSAPVPGCRVEFCDTAPLPGRFRLRIGEALYDVMEARIEVDGTIHSWEAESTAAQ